MSDAIDPAAPAEPVVARPAPSALRHGRMLLLLLACALVVAAYRSITPLEVAIVRHYLPIDFDQGQVRAINAYRVADGELALTASPNLVRGLILAKYGWWVPPFLLQEGPSATGVVVFDTQEGDADAPVTIPWTVQLAKRAEPPTLRGHIPAQQLALLIAPYCDLDNGLLSLTLSVDSARLWIGTGLSGRYEAGVTANGTMQIGYGSHRSTVRISRIAAHTPVTFQRVAGGWTPQLAIQLDAIDLSDPRYALLNLPASRAQLAQLIMAKLRPALSALVIPEWCPRTTEVELSVGAP